MRILVVEDERAVRGAPSRAVRLHGFQVEEAPNGQLALQMLGAAEQDLVWLDVLVPGIDGFETCRRLRAASHPMPVLMLTARDGVDDRVTGSLGAAPRFDPSSPRLVDHRSESRSGS